MSFFLMREIVEEKVEVLAIEAASFELLGGMFWDESVSLSWENRELGNAGRPLGIGSFIFEGRDLGIIEGILGLELGYQE